MAVSFIPNQPILFEDPLFAGQTCLNNDIRNYAQLVQAGDTTCVQWKTNIKSILFDCEANQVPNAITNGNFDILFTGWNEIDFSGNSYPVTNYSYTGTGAFTNGGVIPLATSTGIPVGNLVMLSFYVTDPTVQITAGVGNISTGLFSYTVNCKINADGRVVIVLYAIGGSDIMFFANGPQEFRDVIVRDITSYSCFLANTESLSWSYVESLNGFEWTDAAANKPLLLLGNLINGNSYKITFKVKNMPTGPTNYIGIYDYTTDDLIALADDNKEYEINYTHTGSTTQVYLLVSNPTLMYGTILYDLKAEELSYDYRIKLFNPTTNSESTWFDSSSLDYPIKSYNDRLIWCFDMSDINDVDTGTPLQSGCYNLVLEDNYSSESFTSYTTINYKATGTHDCSVMVVGDNSGYAFDLFFNDPSSTTSFTLRQRLRLLQFNPIYPAKSEEYLYSDGNHIRTYAETGKFRTAWFDYCDEPTHDVIRLQLLSDTFTIDGVEYFCKAEDYEPEWGTNGKYNLAQSRVVLKAVQEKTLFNKSCQ